MKPVAEAAQLARIDSPGALSAVIDGLDVNASFKIEESGRASEVVCSELDPSQIKEWMSSKEISMLQ